MHMGGLALMFRLGWRAQVSCPNSGSLSISIAGANDQNTVYLLSGHSSLAAHCPKRKNH